MLPLTLNQAASACHKSKAALLQAIRSGRLSAIKGDTGQWEIQPAELFRVYPVTSNLPGNENRDQPGNVTDVTDVTRVNSGTLPGAVDIDRERKQYEERIAELKDTVDDLRKRLDASEGERRQLSLTHQPIANPEPISEPTESKLLLKLFGRKA